MRAIIYETASFPVIEMNDTEYFVVGRCTSGSRHYSESLTLSNASDIFDKYKALVDYFGGGTVELIACRGSSSMTVNFAIV